MVAHLGTIYIEEIVAPSSTIMNTHIIEYGKLADSRCLILYTTVSIGDETPWRRVETMPAKPADPESKS